MALVKFVRIHLSQHMTLYAFEIQNKLTLFLGGSRSHMNSAVEWIHLSIPSLFSLYLVTVRCLTWGVLAQLIKVS